MVKWIKNTKAFTLIELMIFIAVIAILLSFMIPNFMGYLEKKNKPVIEQQYEQKKSGGHQGAY